MSGDVGKGLDAKQDEWEMRCTAGDRSEVEGTLEGEGSGVKQSGVRGFPLHILPCPSSYPSLLLVLIVHPSIIHSWAHRHPSLWPSSYPSPIHVLIIIHHSYPYGLAVIPPSIIYPLYINPYDVILLE